MRRAAVLIAIAALGAILFLGFARVRTAAAVQTANHHLTIGKGGDGTGTVKVVSLGLGPAPGVACAALPCESDVLEGTVLTLTATPAAGSVFVGWSGGCTGRSPVCTVTMNEDVSATATFARVKCVVPNVRGKTLAVAKKAIVRAKCAVGSIRHARSRTVKRGRVISQAPPPRTSLGGAARVNLVVSRGPR